MIKCISKIRGLIIIIVEAIILKPIYDILENHNIGIYRFHTVFFILIACLLLFLAYKSHILEYEILFKNDMDNYFIIKKMMFGIKKKYKISDNVEYITGCNSSYLGILYMTSVILKLKSGKRFVLNTAKKRKQNFEDTNIYIILFKHILKENPELELAKDNKDKEISYCYILPEYALNASNEK